MTNETKTTNETDRRVAELERELAHVRRQNRMLHCVRKETFRAMFEFMHRPENADEHSYRLQLVDYVKHLGFLYYLPRDWDKEYRDLVDIPWDDRPDRTAQ
jgi:hypothetical protein